MCADGAREPGKRFGYGNAVEAVVRVWREEGVRAFGKGVGANVARSVLMSEYRRQADVDLANPRRRLANCHVSYSLRLLLPS